MYIFVECLLNDTSMHQSKRPHLDLFSLANDSRSLLLSLQRNSRLKFGALCPCLCSFVNLYLSFFLLAIMSICLSDLFKLSYAILLFGLASASLSSSHYTSRSRTLSTASNFFNSTNSTSIPTSKASITSAGGE